MAAFLTDGTKFLYKNTYQINILTDKLSSATETASVKFSLIKKYNETLQIFVGNRQNGAIKFCEPVNCTASCAGVLYVGTESGNVYRIPESKINDIIRSTEHRKRKQLPKKQNYDEEDDIFGSLLGAKKDGTRISFEEPIQTYICSDRYKILNCPGIKNIYVSCGLIVTLCFTQDCVTLFTYDVPDTASKTSEAKPILSCSVLTNPSKRNVASCVLSFVKPFEPGSNEENCLYLNKVVYNKLFTVDANLLDVPVVIVGFATGSVYAVPLHAKFDTVLLYQGRGAIVAIQGMTIQETDATTRDLLEISFGYKDRGTPDSGCTTLALCCVDGNIVLIHGHESCQDLTYITHYLHGPAVCASASGSFVVVSTFREMYKFTLKIAKDKGGVLSVEQEKSKLGFGNITNFVLHGATNEALSITAVNTKGSVLHVTSERPDPHHHLRNRVYGDQMKELLSKITKISEYLLHESNKSEKLDQVLSQLNIAMQIHLEYSSSFNHCDKCRVHRAKSRTLEMNFKVLHQHQGIFSNKFLELNIQNSGNILLHSGWKFAVSLHTTNPFCELQHSTTQTFVLPKLQPGQSHIITISLSREDISNLPLTVRTCLIFSPNISNHATGDEICDFQPVCVSLPEQRLDILSFCSRKTPGDGRTLTNLKPSLGEELQVISENRLQALVVRNQSSQPGPASDTAVRSNWTSTFMVGDRGRCKMCFEQVGFSPECCMLNQILEWNTLENNLPTTKLCTPYGDVVSLVVEGASGGKCRISVQGPSLMIVQELAQAMQSRLVQKSDDDGQVKLNRRHLNQALQNFELLRRELQKLYCDMKEEDRPSQAIIEKFLEVYQRLREIDIFS